MFEAMTTPLCLLLPAPFLCLHVITPFFPLLDALLRLIKHLHFRFFLPTVPSSLLVIAPLTSPYFLCFFLLFFLFFFFFFAFSPFNFIFPSLDYSCFRLFLHFIFFSCYFFFFSLVLLSFIIIFYSFSYSISTSSFVIHCSFLFRFLFSFSSIIFVFIHFSSNFLCSSSSSPSFAQIISSSGIIPPANFIIIIS